MSKKITTGFMTIALVLGVAAGAQVSDADAAAKKRRTLLEALFPNAAKRAEQRRVREQNRAFGESRIDQQKNAKPIKKVQGARYYAYRVEGFRSVKLAGIIAAVSKIKTESDQLTTGSVVAEPSAESSIAAVKDFPIYMDDYIGSEDTVATLPEQMSEPQVLKPHVLSIGGLEKIKLRGEAKLLSQVEKHYNKSPEYFWIDRDFNVKQNVAAVLNIFETANAYGLDPKNYQLKSIQQLVGEGYTQEEAATQFELSLSVNVLRYMADARSGAVNPNKISGYHDFAKYKRDYKKHLSSLIDSELPEKVMVDAHPSNGHFKKLKLELETLLASEEENELEPIATGTFLKPGNVNSELPKVLAAISKFGSKELLEAHSVVLAAYDGSDVYDGAIVDLVKAYQAEKKLTPDGIVGRRTLDTLTIVSARSKIAKIKLAMERIRWHPNNFGSRHVLINQPAYQANYVVNGASQLSMRVIVGKRANQTNFFYDTIESVEFNPYWNVPRSILVNEKLSRLQADPYYYQQRGFEILKHGGKAVDPGSINWYDEKSTRKYYIRQLPGGRNALGELKILFPNKHNIYMHDTPSRGLFKRSKRALSHGCVRLHRPRDMAAAVMGTSVSKISSIIKAGKNKAMRVPNKLPVYVSYFTAFPRNNGNIGYYPDIYGRDKALGKAIKATSTARAKAVTS